MIFESPQDVCNVIDCMWKADLLRAPNRTLLVQLFDGFPPYTQEEQVENKLEVNINFKEATMLGQQARGQFSNAFLKPEHYFNVRLGAAPIHKRDDWGRYITAEINRPMKKSWSYTQLLNEKFAGVVLHGTGAQHWETKYGWEPRFVAIEDLMIPTDTKQSLKELPYFGIRRIYTPGELARKIRGKNVDPGWNKKAVYQILDQIKFENSNTSAMTWMDSPEKMESLIKQNNAAFEADGAPSIIMWDFFYCDDTAAKPSWRRRMILGNNNGVAAMPDQWVYDGGNRSAGRDLHELIHIQFGDLNNKPPFMYHAVRSLGFLLYDVCSMMNRLRCRFTERVFQDLLTLIRVNDPSDRARQNMIALYNKGIVEDGVSFVKNEDRPQVNANLVQELQANFRQLMSESASSYTQDIDNGTSREVTATETMARVNQVNAMVGGMLNLAYVQENRAYQEIARRFCIPDSEDRDVKLFQMKCQSHGIPKKWLNPDLWEITPETTLGSGNKTLEIAQAKALMEARPLYEPSAQRKILHIYTEAMSDSRLAADLVPLEKGPQVSDSVHDAELSFAAMMDGTPVSPREGVNHTEQIETLLVLMGLRIKRIMMTGGMGTPDDVVGFRLVARNIAGQMDMLATDPSMKQKLTAYEKALTKNMNYVKAFHQRQQQAMQEAQAQGGGMDPEAMAKIQSQRALTQSKIQDNRLKTIDGLKQKDAKFRQQQAQDAAKTRAEIHRDNLYAASEMQADRARTAVELHDTAMVGAVNGMPEAGEDEA